ncbi:hypothetical protein [Niallia sp. MER 6]|uniref:hypothetical protein n=1 Tax=Niallia sp. MER 6 TaxID=2939567 RepID=UPI00203E84E6|nr:hypothetical protein [Niallia sp. MER 6]MCM3034277.1 hypothetical protein [Niallia sp. MER 6]
MNTNTQMSRDADLYKKKNITIRTVLNIYGIFAVVGLILSIYTIPVSINNNMQFFYNEELLMDQKKIKEFLIFIFSSAVVYFFIQMLITKYFDK